MPNKDECLKVVRAFRVKHAIDAPDANIVATIHLMNKHGLDSNAALDQSSRSANDHGIDAWCYNPQKHELFVYQSKLSDAKGIVVNGFSDLERAREWVEAVVVTDQLDQAPVQNHCLRNLHMALGRARQDIKRVHFILVSPLDANELEDHDEFIACGRAIAQSKLYTVVSDRPGGKVTLRAEEYDLDPSVVKETKTYSVERISHTTVELRKNAHLYLAYLRLFSLVELYRQRGDVLFDKNVRMSLANTKEAKARLVNPMEATLDAIVNGQLSPHVFPFYHIGVTLAASTSSIEDDNMISLEAPSIINGCQTIVIANEFIRRLERQKAMEAIETFKLIKVIAKVVVGTTNEELKEITNSNNRQNPIENWQLFSNEPVHIEIEAALKDAGVFYERQKGKFDSVMRNSENAKHYFATNGTFVQVFDLAQIVALARQNLQWAAKPSDVFTNKETHDKCFDKYVVRNPRDIIFASNLYKALKRGLNSYLEMPAHANSNATVIFKKPIIRAHVYSMGLLHYYQSEKRRAARAEHSRGLHKRANAKLVDELQQVFYQRVVTKVRQWYTEESKGLSVEVAKKRTDAYFATLASELGIEDEGLRAFTAHSIDWREYQSA